MVYVPQEDSYLLLSQVKKYACGKVLDMGTGSGIQAIAASQVKAVKSVTGVDVDTAAIKKCRKKSKKVAWKNSDLFSAVKGKFDTIIFNPPYLPQDTGILDIALYGGKHGYEITAKFLNSVNDHLNAKGIVLLLFSSQTKKNKVEEYIEKNLLEFQCVAKHHQFFEDLYVYKLVKRDVLKVLEKKGIRGLQYLDKGKRGIVFTGKYKGKKIAVKIRRASSKAVNRLENEAAWLARLNKKKVGPQLLFHGPGYLGYEFVKGKLFLYSQIHHKTGISPITSTLHQIFPV